MRLLLALLLALTLSACSLETAAQAPVDLAPVLESVAAVDARIVALDQRVTVLTAELDVLGERVVDLDENQRDRMAALLGAATDLHALVQQPLSLKDVDFASIEVLLVTATPDVIDFLLLSPGECPEDLPLPRNRVHAGETAVTIAWPAPTGPHCITSPATDARAAFGTQVDVPAGAIGSVALLPPLE